MTTRPNTRRTQPHPNPNPNPNPQPSNPTIKTHLKPSTTTTSTVYNLTNHFTTPSKPHHSQPKPISKPPILDPLTLKLGYHDKRVFLGSEGSKSLVVVGEKKLKKVEKKQSLKSFCDVKMELTNFMVNNGAKVLAVDMSPFMQIHAVGFARKTKDCLEKFTSKSLALSLKREFDEVYGPAWHCVVGTSFGSFVTHSVGGFLYFALDRKLFILFFKTTVHRAD